MHTFVLQDWTTIRGSGSAGAGATITQNETDWLDLSPFQDVFFWVAVSEVAAGATVALYFDTSPTVDDALFVSINGLLTPAIAALAASATPTVVKVPMLSAAVPISRYLRWRLTLTSAAQVWDATFRIVVAANSPGM